MTSAALSLADLIALEFDRARARRKKAAPKSAPADVDKLVAAIGKLAEWPLNQNADAQLILMKTIADSLAALADRAEAPREWRFSIARDSSGRMTTVEAKAVGEAPHRDVTVAIDELDEDVEEDYDYDDEDED